jgi:hypothetical protein
MAPDLAVEVLSPSESRVRSDSVSVLSRNDVIDGEAVLPGFRLPVSEAFG